MDWHVYVFYITKFVAKLLQRDRGCIFILFYKKNDKSEHISSACTLLARD